MTDVGCLRGSLILRIGLRRTVRQTQIDITNCEIATQEREMATATAKKSKPAKKTNLIPLGDRVVLQRDVAEDKTAGGIVLPDSARDKPQRGTVVAVGDGHVKSDGTRIELTVKAGDKVLFSSYAGEEISVGDDEFLLLRESDILATI
jgi:chaperonin GroES